MKNKNTQEIHIFRASIIIFSICVFLLVGFYFLSGEQLLYKDSKSNISMVQPDCGVAELSQGVVVDQIFTTEIEKLESITVYWGAFYRVNYGTINIQLIDLNSGEIYMNEDFDASQLGEGSPLTVTATEPLDNLSGIPIYIHITSDSVPGSAATPLYQSNGSREGCALFLNSQLTQGLLSFDANGKDCIWIGQHYWLFCCMVLIVLGVFLLIENILYKHGKHSYIVNFITAIRKYSFLISQLVSRDFKTKYKRSILGIFWSFLNPLLMMLIQYFVFSNLFKTDVTNFPVYLLIGTVCFNFFSEACGMCLTSILGNAGLLTKVYVPKYIYPLTRTLSSVINMLISIIPLVIVCLFTGVRFEKSALLSIHFFVCLIIFCFGLGMLLSALMVFFRDMQFLWGVLTMVWMYATPIFYPEKIIPQEFRFVLDLNPLFHFIKNIRICLIDGISPEPFVYMQCLLIAVAMLLVGSFVFKKSQDKFVLYL